MMTVVTPEILTKAEAIARAKAIAAKMGDIDAFKARAERYELSVEELACYNELLDLEFLAGE